MRGAQETRMLLNHWRGRRKLTHCEYLWVHIECKLHLFISVSHYLSTWCVYVIDEYWSHYWASHPPQVIGSRLLKTFVIHFDRRKTCWSKMASIQRTPAWTRLVRSCYCPLPTFVHFWLPHITRNFSLFASRITWPYYFAKWGQPRFLVDLSMHLTCPCTIAADGVVQCLSKIFNDTKTEPDEIESRQTCSKVGCLLELQSIHEKWSHRTQRWNPAASCSNWRLEAAKLLFGMPSWAW